MLKIFSIQQQCTHISPEKLASPPVNFGLRPGLTKFRAGVETDPKKIQVVKEWPTPSYVTDVLGFLGFAITIGSTLKGTLASPVRLLCKDTDLKWTKEHTKAFTELKTAPTQAPVLAIPQDDG